MQNIVVGAGYAGAVVARILAEKLDEKVLILEKRPHIAGNMYDEPDAAGVLVHRYGPHIAVMNSERCFNFLSRFTSWLPYEHRVNALVDGLEVPLPINFNSIRLLYPKDKAARIVSGLLDRFGSNQVLPVLKLKDVDDHELRGFAEDIYEKVFLHYTMKMWGLSPTQIDPAVTARIPIRLSFDDRHFLHKFQVMPKHGYTALFRNLLDHPNITAQCSVNAKDLISIDEQRRVVCFEGAAFNGRVIYTGPLDELLDYRFGALPYRSLRMEFETHPLDSIQQTTVLNWPDSRPATRRTEMKKLTQQKLDAVTSTITEYPGEYVKGDENFGEPMYPILNDQCRGLHGQYKTALIGIPRFYAVGRLAQYEYTNMEETVLRALDTAATILTE